LQVPQGHRAGGSRASVARMPGTARRARSPAADATAWRHANSCLCSIGEFLEYVPRDDESLDLGRTFADLADLGITHVALDRVVLRVTVPAVHLYCLDGITHGQLRTEELCHRGHLSDRAALLCKPGRMEDEMPARLDLGRHV